MTSSDKNPFRERKKFELCKEILASIDEKFPSEESRVLELCRVMEVLSLKESVDKCSSCKGETKASKTNLRKFRCLRCGKRGSYLAKTICAGTSRTRSWLALLTFSQKRVELNAFQFHQLLDIAYSTAHSMYLKLGYVVADRLKKQQNAIEVSSYIFKETIGKRSRVTASHIKPCQERYFDETRLPAAAAESSQSTQENDRQIRIAKLRDGCPEIDAVLGIIQDKNPAHFDVLCGLASVDAGKLSAVLSMMELDRLVIRIPGESYIPWEDDYVCPRSFRCICENSDKPAAKCPYHKEKKRVQQQKNEPELPLTNKRGRDVSPKSGAERELARLQKQLLTEQEIKQRQLIAQIHRTIRSVRRRFHAVSRKYLQIYIALDWCQRDKLFWTKDRFMEACDAAEDVSRAAIRAYNTTDSVKICPPKMRRAA